MAAPSSTLHPPRLAPIFAGSPSAPGTPVHSIQTMRRKAAGHGGPLTKILVANRGVRRDRLFPHIASNNAIHRKSPSEFFEPPMSLQCTPLPSIPMKIAYRPIVRRSVAVITVTALLCSAVHVQSDEAYQVGKGLTPVGAYLAQDDIIRIALEHGVDMIHPG